LDGVFSASESIGTWTGTPPVALSNFNFTVPAGAQSGQSRLRVMQAEQLSLPLDPCASFSWGSVTDFSVTIQNGIDCSAYIGDDINDPREVNTFPYAETYDNSVCYSNQNPVYNSPDVYYLVIPTGNFPGLTASLCGSSFDTFMTVLDAQGDVIAINDDHSSCGTQSKITFSTVGHDSVYVIVEGWGNQSGTYNITIEEDALGVDELDQSPFMPYPNPASSEFSIGNQFNGHIQLLNSAGRIVLEKDVIPNQSIDVNELKQGFYIVRLEMNNKIYDRKLILRK